MTYHYSANVSADYHTRVIHGIRSVEEVAGRLARAARYHRTPRTIADAVMGILDLDVTLYADGYGDYPDVLVEIPHTGYGYGQDVVEISNRRSFDDDPLHWQGGDHREAVAMVVNVTEMLWDVSDAEDDAEWLDRVDEVVNTLASLTEYPIRDESVWSDVEEETYARDFPEVLRDWLAERDQEDIADDMDPDRWESLAADIRWNLLTTEGLEEWTEDDRAQFRFTCDDAAILDRIAALTA